MAFLRQQLLVLKRSAPTKLRLRTADRLIFVWLYRLFPSLLGAAVIFKPETLVRWHRSGFRLYWRWKSRRRVGRPAVRNHGPFRFEPLGERIVSCRDLKHVKPLTGEAHIARDRARLFGHLGQHDHFITRGH
jgi:hypothetical protein